MKKFLKRAAFLALALITLFMTGGLAEDALNAVEAVTVRAKLNYLEQQFDAALTLTSDEDGCSVIKYEGSDFQGAITNLLIQLGMDTIVIDTGDGAMEIKAADMALAIEKLMSDINGEQSFDFGKVYTYMNTQLEADAQYITTILSSEVSRLMMLSMQNGLLTYSSDGSIMFSATLSQMCDLVSAYLTGIANDPVSLSLIKELKLWEAFDIDASQFEVMLPSMLLDFAEQVKKIPSMRMFGDVQINILADGSVTLKVNFSSSDISFNVSGQFNAQNSKLTADVLADDVVMNLTFASDASSTSVSFDASASDDEYLKASFKTDFETTTVSAVYRDGDDDAWQAEFNAVNGVGKGNLYLYKGYDYDSYGYYNSDYASAYGDLFFDLNKCEFALDFMNDNYGRAFEIGASYRDEAFDFEFVQSSSYGDLEFCHKLNIAGNRLLYKGIINGDYVNTIDVSAVFDDDNLYADISVFLEGGVYVSGSVQCDMRNTELTFDLSVYAGDVVFVTGRLDSRTYEVTIRANGTEAKLFGTYSYMNGVFDLYGELSAKMQGVSDAALTAGKYAFYLNLNNAIPTYNLSFNAFDVPRNPLNELASLESYFDGKTWYLDMTQGGVSTMSITANLVDLPDEKSIEINMTQNESVTKIVAGVRDMLDTATGSSGTLFFEQYADDEQLQAFEIPFAITTTDNNHYSFKADVNVPMYGEVFTVLGADIDVSAEYAAPEKHVSGTPLSVDEIYAMLSMLLG